MTTTYPDHVTSTWRADDLVELAEANMSGLVDGTTRRLLPAGVEILCTSEWLDAYNAGHAVGLDASPQHRQPSRCSMCHTPILLPPGRTVAACGPCRREAAGL